MRSRALIVGCLLGVVGGVPVARAQPAPAQVAAAIVVEAPEPPRTELMNAVRGHLGQRGVFVLDEVATAAGRANVTAGQPRVLSDADVGALRLALNVPLVVVVSVTPGTPSSSVAITLGRGDGLFKRQTQGTAQDLTSRVIAELTQLPMDAGPAGYAPGYGVPMPGQPPHGQPPQGQPPQPQPVIAPPASSPPASSAASERPLGPGGAGFFMPIYGSLKLSADGGGSDSESGPGITFGAGSWFNEHIGVGAGGNIIWAQPNDFVDLLSWGAGADLFLRLNRQLMGAVYAGYGRVDFIVDEAVGSSTKETGMQLGLTAIFKFGGPFGVGACVYRTSLDGGAATTLGIGLTLAN